MTPTRPVALTGATGCLGGRIAHRPATAAYRMIQQQKHGRLAVMLHPWPVGDPTGGSPARMRLASVAG